MKTINLEKLDKIFPKAYFEFASGINEPGYDDKPVILANWNRVPHHVFDKIESLGYACEWSDEWCSCSDCGKIFRTTGNGYDWIMAGYIGDGEALCLDCIDPTSYYESFENDARRRVLAPIVNRYPLEDHGYELVRDDLKHSWHGDTFKPGKVLAEAIKNDPDGRFIFVIDYSSQFEWGYSLYKKI